MPASSSSCWGSESCSRAALLWARLGLQGCERTIAPLLSDPDPDVRAAVTQALACCGSEEGAWALFEALGPLIEVAGYVVITLSLVFGWLSTAMAIAFFGVAVALGIAFSFGALLVEERAFQRYRRWRCFGRLVVAAGIENLGYRQWYAVVRAHASWLHLRGRPLRWGEMSRAGFATADSPTRS